MSDIETELCAAMHAAVDGEVASPEQLIKLVKRRHRRANTRLASAAMLVVLAVTVSIVVALHGAVGTAGSPPASNATPSSAKLPTAMSGLPMPAGMTFEFLMPTWNGAGWYSTATQRTEPIAGLPSAEGGYTFVRLAGGWVASPVTYSSPCPRDVCAGTPTTFYFIADGSLTATRIGTGYHYDGVDAGARAGTVWLVTYPRSNTSLDASSFVQLVTTAGQPIGPRYRMPADYLMGRGVGRYVLLDFDGDNETHYELWDPATGRILGHFDNVVAQGPDQVVWSKNRRGSPLEITNVSTGKTVTTSIHAGASANTNVALSDDGRLLAVQLPGQDVTIVNTRTGATTRIPGTALTGADFEGFDWQNAGHRLMITAGPNGTAGPDQIAYWQPGETKLHVTTIRNRLELPAIETGAY